MAHDGRITLFLASTPRTASYLLAQVYAHHIGLELIEATLPLGHDVRHSAAVHASHAELFPFRRCYGAGDADPLAGVLAALAASPSGETLVEIAFQPVRRRAAERRLRFVATVLDRHRPRWLQQMTLSRGWRKARTALQPFTRLGAALLWLAGSSHEETPSDHENLVTAKLAPGCFATTISVHHAGRRDDAGKVLPEIAAAMATLSDGHNQLTLGAIQTDAIDAWLAPVKGSSFLLDTLELSGLVHVPAASSEAMARRDGATHAAPVDLPPVRPETLVLGLTNHRGRRQPFGLEPEDRRRHLYILGKTGMGKTTLLEHLIVSDLQA